MKNPSLPDVQSDARPQKTGTLDWVGMERVAVPIAIPVGDGVVSCSALADIVVSLDAPEAKGIHMSRLYLKLNEMLANQTLDLAQLNRFTDAMISSQKGQSESARVVLSFDLPLNKKALLSDNFGYQSYAIVIRQELSAGAGQRQTELEMTIPYSSTCPCSAALARQLIAEAVDKQFDEGKVDKAALLAWLAADDTALATPHNQRSYAYIKLTLNDNAWPNLAELIFELEDIIGTPVQTAVKRVDEQAFAKLNGDNLMFCEDAGRRLKHGLDNKSDIADYWFKVEHQESLHAHNAVVIHRKGQ